MEALERDRALIEQLGGPAKVASLLHYDKDGGVQRVQNWLKRGIPASVKLDHPDIFLPEFKRQKKRSPTNHPGERATDKAGERA